MATLTIGNRRLEAFAATEAKNEFGHVLETFPLVPAEERARAMQAFARN
jgi:hypothetical protein